MSVPIEAVFFSVSAPSCPSLSDLAGVRPNALSVQTWNACFNSCSCVTSVSLLETETFGLFQVAAKCFQKGGALEKEKLALAHNAALNMKSKKVSPK